MMNQAVVSEESIQFTKAKEKTPRSYGPVICYGILTKVKYYFT